MKISKSFQIEIYSMNMENKETELYEINEMKDLIPVLEKYEIVEKGREVEDLELSIGLYLDECIGQLVFAVLKKLKYILIKWI